MTRPKAKRFPRQTLVALREGKILGIRAGREHRIIGIWMVVVEDRLFVRSWTVKPDGWFRTFQRDPNGIIAIGDREFPIRAVLTRSERLKNAVSRAYLEKYNTPASLKYSKGLGRARSRATTSELVPAR